LSAKAPGCRAVMWFILNNSHPSVIAWQYGVLLWFWMQRLVVFRLKPCNFEPRYEA
jgi:hypothetical protein